MSIIQVIDPDFEFWQTGIDPGQPEAVWRSSGRVTGDATGGFQALQLDFQKATEPLSARMWSLESIAARFDGSADALEVSATNLGEVLNAAPNTGSGFAVQFLPSGIDEHLVGRDLAFLPWFLGAPRQRATAAGMFFAINNVLGVILDIWVRGYVWGPRSQTIQGGPRRPVGSVFG